MQTRFLLMSKTQHNKYNTIPQTPKDTTQQNTTDTTQQNTVPNKTKICQNRPPSVSFLLNWRIYLCIGMVFLPLELCHNLHGDGASLVCYRLPLWDIGRHIPLYLELAGLRWPHIRQTSHNCFSGLDLPFQFQNVGFILNNRTSFCRFNLPELLCATDQ